MVVLYKNKNYLNKSIGLPLHQNVGDFPPIVYDFMISAYISPRKTSEYIMEYNCTKRHEKYK